MVDPAIGAAAARRAHFYIFLAQVFKQLHDEDMPDDIYLRALAHALQTAHQQDGGRLVVTIPPRHLKSIAAAVALPAWALGHDPSCKIIVATYGDELSRKHAAHFAQVMNSAWYQSLFPSTRIKTSNSAQLETTRGGSRRCVSTAGAATGFGADLIIVDDLMKAQDASSDVLRDKAYTMLTETLMSRFDNPARGSVISIQQRLHEDDVPGRLIETGKYNHLNLPAIAEVGSSFPIGLGRYWKRKPGDLLNPERMDRELLERRRDELGAYAFSAQYQQNPVPPDGAVVRLERIKQVSLDEMPDGADCEYIIQSWDTAASLGPKSDFSVCTTWGFYENCWYLLDLFRERVEYDALESKVFRLINTYQPDKVLIEDNSNGRAFLQRQRMAKKGILFQSVIAKDSKEDRLITQLDFLHSDRVCFCNEDPWWPELKRELSAFPMGRYDDQVDSISQFLKWITGRFGRRLLNTHGKTGKVNLLKGENGRYKPYDGTR